MRVNALLPRLMKTSMVEKALDLTDRYGAGDLLGDLISAI